MWILFSQSRLSTIRQYLLQHLCAHTLSFGTTDTTSLPSSLFNLCLCFQVSDYFLYYLKHCKKLNQVAILVTSSALFPALTALYALTEFYGSNYYTPIFTLRLIQIHLTVPPGTHLETGLQSFLNVAHNKSVPY